jgi:hypothetical protein
MKHQRMQNLSFAQALKKVPADCELVYAFDEGENLWICFYNIDVPAVDERGNPCESGMRSIPVAEFDTEEQAKEYVKNVYQLDAQLSEHGMSVDECLKMDERLKM